MTPGLKEDAKEDWGRGRRREELLRVVPKSGGEGDRRSRRRAVEPCSNGIHVSDKYPQVIYSSNVNYRKLIRRTWGKKQATEFQRLTSQCQTVEASALHHVGHAYGEQDSTSARPRPMWVVGEDGGGRKRARAAHACHTPSPHSVFSLYASAATAGRIRFRGDRGTIIAAAPPPGQRRRRGWAHALQSTRVGRWGEGGGWLPTRGGRLG